jgi:hypothetical protein
VLIVLKQGRYCTSRASDAPTADQPIANRRRGLMQQGRRIPGVQRNIGQDHPKAKNQRGLIDMKHPCCSELLRQSVFWAPSFNRRCPYPRAPAVHDARKASGRRHSGLGNQASSLN